MKVDWAQHLSYSEKFYVEPASDFERVMGIAQGKEPGIAGVRVWVDETVADVEVDSLERGLLRNAFL